MNMKIIYCAMCIPLEVNHSKTCPSLFFIKKIALLRTLVKNDKLHTYILKSLVQWSKACL
jgi:hypothetical protein